MKDPFGVHTAGDLTVTCQIIHMDHQDGATIIDLVTLEPCSDDDRDLPAGSPLTVGFESSYRQEDRMVLEKVVRGWEDRDAVLVLEVADGERGICYQFSDGEEHLLIVLDELPPA